MRTGFGTFFATPQIWRFCAAPPPAVSLAGFPGLLALEGKTCQNPSPFDGARKKSARQDCGRGIRGADAPRGHPSRRICSEPRGWRAALTLQRAPLAALARREDTGRSAPRQISALIDTFSPPSRVHPASEKRKRRSGKRRKCVLGRWASQCINESRNLTRRPARTSRTKPGEAKMANPARRLHRASGRTRQREANRRPHPP